MIPYIARRIVHSLGVLLLVSLAVFFAVYAVGNPVELLVSPDASALERDILTERLGLDRPVWQQYFVFLGNAVHGDLGTSFVHNESALTLILERLPATLELVLLSLVMALMLGIPLGLLAGYRANRPTGDALMTGSILGFSLPNFWQGMMLIMLFAVWLGWLPASGRGDTVEFLGIRTSLFTADGFSHLILPALNLAIGNIALVLRLTASGSADTLQLEHVRFARAKGLSPALIARRHVLKNILIPIVTVVGIEFGTLIAFSTITETVFAWPGMGKLLIDSIYRLDRPVVVAYVMLVTLMFVIVNLLVDVLYAALDPRVDLEGKGA